MSKAQCDTKFTPKKRKLCDKSKGAYCIVCRNDGRKIRDIAFHSFPDKGNDFVTVTNTISGEVIKKDRLTLWCEFANITESKCKWKKLCSAHFDRSDFLNAGVSGRKRRRLKRTAVPHRIPVVSYPECSTSATSKESFQVDIFSLNGSSCSNSPDDPICDSGSRMDECVPPSICESLSLGSDNIHGLTGEDCADSEIVLLNNSICNDSKDDGPTSPTTNPGQQYSYLSVSVQQSKSLAGNNQAPMDVDQGKVKMVSVSTQTDFSHLKKSSMETQTEICDLCHDKESVSTQVTSGDFKKSFSTFLDTDRKINAFTGVATLNLFLAIVQLYEMLKPRSNKSSLSTENKVLLCLLKLKLNLPFRVLSVFFDLAPAGVKFLFNETIHTLNTCLQSVLYWPSKEEIVSNMPLSFLKNGFAKVRVILDGTEIKTTKTKCIKCRCKAFSFYKGHHTIKIMVGISPGGLITYISKPFGGRASDKFIFSHCGIINLLEPYCDSVMVDKGFLIKEICSEHNIDIVMPAFMRKNCKYTPAESKKTRQVAACRVHVERAIGRMKSFRILRDVLPWSLCGYAEVISRVVAALVNLSPPLIGIDKFPATGDRFLHMSLNNTFETNSDYEDIELLEVSFQ